MEHLVFKVDGQVLHLHVEYPLGVALLDEAKDAGLLLEAINKPIGKGYSIRRDPPHDPVTGQVHAHGCDRKGRELFALNFDGSAHDGYHQTRIPKRFIEPLQKLGFAVPPDRLIESIDIDPSVDLLLTENAGVDKVVEGKLDGFREFLKRSDIDWNAIIEKAVRRHFDE
jgi:hypothetical protein